MGKSFRSHFEPVDSAQMESGGQPLALGQPAVNPWNADFGPIFRP